MGSGATLVNRCNNWQRQHLSAGRCRSKRSSPNPAWKCRDRRRHVDGSRGARLPEVPPRQRAEIGKTARFFCAGHEPAHARLAPGSPVQPAARRADGFDLSTSMSGPSSRSGSGSKDLHPCHIVTISQGRPCRTEVFVGFRANRRSRPDVLSPDGRLAIERAWPMPWADKPKTGRRYVRQARARGAGCW
jgi:hypothetical protein